MHEFFRIKFVRITHGFIVRYIHFFKKLPSLRVKILNTTTILIFKAWKLCARKSHSNGGRNVFLFNCATAWSHSFFFFLHAYCRCFLIVSVAWTVSVAHSFPAHLTNCYSVICLKETFLKSLYNFDLILVNSGYRIFKYKYNAFPDRQWHGILITELFQWVKLHYYWNSDCEFSYYGKRSSIWFEFLKKN